MLQVAENRYTVKRFSVSKFSFSYIKVLLLLLLLLGTFFSKLNIAGPFYLYDLLLIIPLPFIISKYSYNKKDLPIILALLVAFAYLFVYVFISKAGLDIVLRQFMLFGYLLIAYLYLAIARNNENFYASAEDFLILFGRLSFLIQSIYIVIVIIFITRNINGAGNYFYYSPVIILGIIVYSIYQLVYSKYKLAWIIFGTILLTTTGHSSAFLSLFIAIFLFYINKLPRPIRVLGFISLIIISFVMLSGKSSFSDNNAQWRFFYWYFTLKNIFIGHFGLLGNGFGVPYADDSTAYFLEVIKEFTTHLSDETESYLSPMHNSFLTIAFHIGFIFSLLIIHPILKVLTAFCTQVTIKNKEYIFIALSLIGVSIWAANNVILELPHSSLFFWLIYFIFFFKFYHSKAF